jgi:hypothetical protein
MENYERAAAAAQQMAEKSGPYYDKWVAGRRAALERELRQIYLDLGLIDDEAPA